MSRTPPLPRPLPARLTTLDLLRFAAALAVVCSHFIGSTTAVEAWGPGVRADEIFPGIGRIAHYGRYGVQLFFVISGFVILMSAWGRNVRQFVASRVARLYPAYWAAVLLTGVVLVFLRGGSVADIHVRTVLTNLTMVQSGLRVPLVDSVYWTLWVELLFYLLIGLVLSAGLTYRRVVTLIALWPIAANLIVYAFPGLNLALEPEFCAFFAGGMALYLVFAYGQSWFRWGLVAVNLVLAVQSDAAHNPPGDASLRGAVLVVLVFVAVALCTLTPARTWGGRLGTGLGKLTYPLYLTHNLWGQYLIRVLYPELNRWLVVLIAVIAVLALAWLINRFVELPLAPRLRRGMLSGLETPERIPTEPRRDQSRELPPAAAS